MTNSSQHSNVDLDALLDLTEYDSLNNYESPSLSPSGTSKPAFASPVNAAQTISSVPTTNTQSLSGPSHNYEMYRQQTGFVPGAIANTMAVNQTNNTGYQDFGSLDYLSNMSPENDIFDFNTSPSQATMDFDSPSDNSFFSTINPNTISQDTAMNNSPPSVGPQSGNVGRLWPGAHSQAALAKAQAQQRQPQPQAQPQPQPQPQQQPQMMQQKPAKRSKGPQPSDPIVEQKITQLLNSMRAKPSSPDDLDSNASVALPRAKKEEEEMDEDERLLASEEGKKLSSKERRQLRNKVSARAFRSRRKEYITQLESEVAAKVNENGDLRTQNRALMDENKRLSDLTRMLLSSPSFSNFLDHLSANPSSIPQAPVKPEPQQQQPQQQQQQQQQEVKDVSPYSAQSSQHQVGMAMIPEQPMDFSMLSLGGNYNFQPQVFVVDTPEFSAPIDTSFLSGKTSNFVESSFDSDDEKVEIPSIERPVVEETNQETTDVAPVDEEFESDPEFALFHSVPAAALKEPVEEPDTEAFSNVDIFGGIDSEKVLARYELVDATEEERTAAFAMARIQRISASMESVVSRLELLTQDL